MLVNGGGFQVPVMINELEDVAARLSFEGMLSSSQECHLCRKCFSQIEKRAKLKADLARLDSDIGK